MKALPCQMVLQFQKELLSKQLQSQLRVAILAALHQLPMTRKRLEYSKLQASSVELAFFVSNCSFVTLMDPKHVRHKEPTSLERERSIILACPDFHSSVNFSRMMRLAGCAGIKRMVVGTSIKPDPNIARDAIDYVQVDRRRTLKNWLVKQKEDYRVVALEQSNQSSCLYDYTCLLYTSPSPRDATLSRMPSSA